MAGLMERAKNAYNAFMNRDPTSVRNQLQFGSSYRPDRPYYSMRNLRGMITSVCAKIAVDVSMLDVKHVKLDDEGRYSETIDDDLNQVLSMRANIDQTGRDFLRDAALTLLQEGCIALVPVLTDKNPEYTDSYIVRNARVGTIVEWFPDSVRVLVYNEKTGKKEEIVVGKRWTPIIENPFYAVMNEPNSTAKQLSRVLAQLDRTNEQNSSTKLDLIIQLPYQVNSDRKRVIADNRREKITEQLTGTEYGIAYIDSTEKVIQLNRSLENNLWTQAQELKQDLYNELGFSEKIFNGTADDKEMLNYQNRTIIPIIKAITEGMTVKWISPTARAQKQSIIYIKDVFSLTSIMDIAKAADTFTRNEIMTSNEIRAAMGMKPSKDPKADQLINSNLNHPDEKGNVKQTSNNSNELDGIQNE